MSGSAADTDARRRGIQRESELLIGNLGQQAKLQRAELVTDMDHIKSLICLHESLCVFIDVFVNKEKNKKRKF
jgi:hypothetical protein